MALKQPVGQKRLTNVAVVRMKSHGIRFEIACYKNKVLNWREGIEKDLNEVLQTETVFTNVSKAVIAKEKDLQKAFGTLDLPEICKKILKDGDVQVSDKEREVHMESLFKDIVQILAERLVHTETGRQLTPVATESALKSIGFSVQPDQPAKKQALKAMEEIQKKLSGSFSRAKMRVRMTFPDHLEEIHKYVLEDCSATIEKSEVATTEPSKEDENDKSKANATTPPKRTGTLRSLTFVCDPSHYRELDRLATKVHAGENVSLHVVTQNVVSATTTGLEGYPEERGPAPATATRNAAPKPAPKKGMKCSSCMADFEDAGDYRSHCRSEWHNFNLKRKVKGLSPLSEDDFAELDLDLREGFRGD